MEFLSVGRARALVLSTTDARLEPKDTTMTLTHLMLSLSNVAYASAGNVAIASEAVKLAASGQFVLAVDGVVEKQYDTAFPYGAMMRAIRFNDPFQPTIFDINGDTGAVLGQGC